MYAVCGVCVACQRGRGGGRRDDRSTEGEHRAGICVSGALQEMKNENERRGREGMREGWDARSTCHRGQLPFLTGN